VRMPKKEPEGPRLGRLETRIMNVVWEKGTASVHDVRDALGGSRKSAYSTILTMMRNLEAKGYLEHEVEDRKYLYRAVVDQQRVRRNVLSDLVQRLFNGSPALLVNSLLQQSDVSPEEMVEIKRLLRDKEAKS
jgi:BlaI family transcriptional regulator, penicillinase repressor